MSTWLGGSTIDIDSCDPDFAGTQDLRALIAHEYGHALTPAYDPPAALLQRGISPDEVLADCWAQAVFGYIGAGSYVYGCTAEEMAAAREVIG